MNEKVNHSAIVADTFKNMGFSTEIYGSRVRVKLNRKVTLNEVRQAIWQSELPLDDNDVYRERLSGWVLVKCLH